MIRHIFRLGLLVGLSLLCSPLVSGQNTSVKPSKYQPRDTAAFYTSLRQIRKQALETAGADLPAPHRDAYFSRTDHIIRGVEADGFLFDSTLTTHLTTIMTTLIDSNGIDLTPTILVSRSPVINAYSLGNGMFNIYNGLLRGVKTNDHLAFVLAHELAHDQLEHYQRTVAKIPTEVVQIDDYRKHYKQQRKAFRKRLRSEGRERIMNEYKQAAYRKGAFSRQKELEADSLALLYLAKTDYDLQGGIRGLSYFDETPPFDVEIDELTRHLSTAKQPLKENWLRARKDKPEATDAKQANAAAWNQDSLSSHPDLALRLAKLEFDTTYQEPTPPVNLHGFRQLSIQETLLSYQKMEYPAHTILLSIRYLEDEPGYEDFYYGIILDAMMTGYLAKEARQLAEKVPPAYFFGAPGSKALCRLFYRTNATQFGTYLRSLVEEKVAAYPDSVYLNQVADRINYYFSGAGRGRQ
ncbi:M48 family metalloprotease [Neolewinella antarctica]|uniref:Peptidase M48 domain-containing protein n=1 Tax=Neolewinella antarctica TaxID=442734 RepID=A0ABX0XD49_9BACT|nr:M48 family metalloprotease [Neolewinella antarctica]NJC26833.1 hypothetical protein [Neolewinella antarctica]